MTARSSNSTRTAAGTRCREREITDPRTRLSVAIGHPSQSGVSWLPAKTRYRPAVGEHPSDARRRPAARAPPFGQLAAVNSRRIPSRRRKEYHHQTIVDEPFERALEREGADSNAEWRMPELCELAPRANCPREREGGSEHEQGRTRGFDTKKRLERTPREANEAQQGFPRLGRRGRKGIGFRGSDGRHARSCWLMRQLDGTRRPNGRGLWRGPQSNYGAA